MENKIEPTISGLSSNSDNLSNDVIGELYLPPDESRGGEPGFDNSYQYKSLVPLNILVMVFGFAYLLLSFVALSKLNLSGAMAILPLLSSFFMIYSGYIPYYNIKYSQPKKNKVMGVFCNAISIVIFLMVITGILSFGHLNPLYSLIPGVLSLPFLVNIVYLVKQ